MTINISRFEVIDPNGRAIVMYAPDIQYSLQDDNKTLKVFVPDDIEKYLIKEQQ